MSEKNSRLYELGFILVPTVPETEVAEAVNSLKTLIKGAEGEVTTEGTTEYIDLAYTIEKTVGSKKNKYSQGYFGWLKFETTPESLESLKKVLDSEANLVRYLLIKTEAGNTISFKKPKIEAKRGDAVIDDADLEDADESVDDIIAAHEALPDLASEVEVGLAKESQE